MSEQEATNLEAGVAEAAEALTQEQSPEAETEATELADGEHAETTVDDLEDIEFEGKQFRGPKAIKDALLRQSDYTRKTQDVAEQRKELETRQAQFQQAEKLQQEHIEAIADLRNIDKQLAQYQQVDWARLWDADPQQAGRLTSQFQMLRQSRETLVSAVQEKERQRISNAEREGATQLEKASAAIKQAVPNWTPEFDQKMGKFVADHGLDSRSVISTIASNPKVASLLHLAMIGAESLTKARAAAKPVAPVATPVPTVSARAAPAAVNPLSDKASPEEWRRAREAQLRKRNGR